MRCKRGDNETDVELRVNGLGFEVEMLLEESHCIQSIPGMVYMFVDLYHYLFLGSVEVVCDDVEMEKVKGAESYVLVIELWGSRTGAQQL